MISTIGLPSGMRFDSPRKANINFNKSELKWYLDNYMSKEIFQNIKGQEEIKEDTIIKEKTKIDILLDELEKEIKNYLGNKEEVYNYIDNLIEDYNKSLDKLNINKDLVLDRRESLELQLQIRLEQILTKIKNSNDKEDATPEMITFLLINTSGVCLIPTTVIAIRNSMGSSYCDINNNYFNNCYYYSYFIWFRGEEACKILAIILF